MIDTLETFTHFGAISECEMVPYQAQLVYYTMLQFANRCPTVDYFPMPETRLAINSGLSKTQVAQGLRYLIVNDYIDEDKSDPDNIRYRVLDAFLSFTKPAYNDYYKPDESPVDNVDNSVDNLSDSVDNSPQSVDKIVDNVDNSVDNTVDKVSCPPEENSQQQNPTSKDLNLNINTKADLNLNIPSGGDNNNITPPKVTSPDSIQYVPPTEDTADDSARHFSPPDNDAKEVDLPPSLVAALRKVAEELHAQLDLNPELPVEIRDFIEQEEAKKNDRGHDQTLGEAEDGIPAEQDDAGEYTKLRP